MAGVFPVKKLRTQTNRESSIESCWAEIDKMLNDNPLAEIVNQNDGGWLPDFTRAIRMTRAIYRVNVPGYFYHHIKNPAVSTKQRAGVSLAPYPCIIDMSIGVAPRMHACKSQSGSGKPEANRELGYMPDNNCIIQLLNGNDAASTVNVRTSDNVVETTLTDKLVTITDPRYAHPSFRSYRSNYFEVTGASNVGGVANNMIPILPGQGSSTVKLANGTSVLMDQVSGRRSGVTTTNAGSGSNTTSYDDGSSSSGKVNFVNVQGKTSTGFFEGRGTYVYFYHTNKGYGDADGNNDADEYLFVPCKCVGTNVKPLTKIRDVFINSLNGYIGAGGTVDLDIAMWHSCIDAFNDHSDLHTILLRKLSEPETDSNALPTDKKYTTVAGFRYKNWTSGKYVERKGCFNQFTMMAALSNQTLVSKKTPFIVQRHAKLPGLEWKARDVYPEGCKEPDNKAPYFTSNPYAWLFKAYHQYVRDLNIFYPTKDDETVSQLIVPKFESQKDLTYE